MVCSLPWGQNALKQNKTPPNKQLCGVMGKGLSSCSAFLSFVSFVSWLCKEKAAQMDAARWSIPVHWRQCTYVVGFNLVCIFIAQSATSKVHGAPDFIRSLACRTYKTVKVTQRMWWKTSTLAWKDNDHQRNTIRCWPQAFIAVNMATWCTIENNYYCFLARCCVPDPL